MTFMEKLEASWKRSGSLVCVGLDPDLAKMPDCVKGAKYPIFEFNKAIIDATAEAVCCYKPQAAYYAGQDADDQLAMTISYIKENYPEIPVILDAKRADIGATTAMYAKEAFERFQGDAVTVNPYMGMDALKPFLDHADKGVIILCRTSNPGAKEIQDIKLESGEEMFMHVARLASTSWNYNKNIALVAGATFPEQLGAIRKVTGDMPLLVPGIGAQGGDIAAVMKNGLDSNGNGLMINSSRGIIYVSKGEDFAEAAGKAALELRDSINAYRKA